MKNGLFINACIRGKDSRTDMLCRAFLDTYEKSHPEDKITELPLEGMLIEPFTNKALQHRDKLCADGRMDNVQFHYAHDFAAADFLIFGAPYWDLSFPAKLKVYIEHVSVAGVTFDYGDSGFVGLCKAEKLLYITTAGDAIGDFNLGYDYIRSVCSRLFGVQQSEFISAEGLDLPNANVEVLMDAAKAKAVQLAAQY